MSAQIYLSGVRRRQHKRFTKLSSPTVTISRYATLLPNSKHIFNCSNGVARHLRQFGHPNNVTARMSLQVRPTGYKTSRIVTRKFNSDKKKYRPNPTRETSSTIHLKPSSEYKDANCIAEDSSVTEQTVSGNESNDLPKLLNEAMKIVNDCFDQNPETLVSKSTDSDLADDLFHGCGNVFEKVCHRLRHAKSQLTVDLDQYFTQMEVECCKEPNRNKTPTCDDEGKICGPNLEFQLNSSYSHPINKAAKDIRKPESEETPNFILGDSKRVCLEVERSTEIDHIPRESPKAKINQNAGDNQNSSKLHSHYMNALLTPESNFLTHKNKLSGLDLLSLKLHKELGDRTRQNEKKQRSAYETVISSSPESSHSSLGNNFHNKSLAPVSHKNKNKKPDIHFDSKVVNHHRHHFNLSMDRSQAHNSRSRTKVSLNNSCVGPPRSEFKTHDSVCSPRPFMRRDFNAAERSSLYRSFRDEAIIPNMKKSFFLEEEEEKERQQQKHQQHNIGFGYQSKLYNLPNISTPSCSSKKLTFAHYSPPGHPIWDTPDELKTSNFISFGYHNWK